MENSHHSQNEKFHYNLNQRHNKHTAQPIERATTITKTIINYCKKSLKKI